MSETRQEIKQRDRCEVTKIVAVTDEGEGWSVKRRDGWLFWVGKEHSVTPHVGDRAVFYGDGIGSPVRGLDLNGVEVFYRTPEEEEERHHKWCEEQDEKRRQEFAKNQAKLDADYEALPLVFRQRLDRFRLANPDFRWKHEAYEMFTCQQAVIIADALKTVEDIDAFKKLPWEEQLSKVPGLSDGHSGNTFDCACYLAKLHLCDGTLVSTVPGALSPLVGTADYSERR